MFAKNKDTPDFEYFTLFDTKVGHYKEPMLAINQHDMVRQIVTVMKNPGQNVPQFITNSEDFQLFKVGNFTKKTGIIIGHAPQHVANLHEIKASIRPEMDVQALSPT